MPRVRHIVTASVLALLMAGSAAALTLPSGVINAPPTVIGDNQSIGSDTTLHVGDGGLVGNGFAAGLPDGLSTNVSVNILGGHVGDGFAAYAGSTVGLSGGVVGRESRAYAGSSVVASGGVIGDGFRAEPNSALELIGGEFMLNGAPYSGSSISLTSEGVLTGTLADGTPFIFAPSIGDVLADATLTSATLPPIAPTPIVVDGATNPAPRGLRKGQQLTLQSGGRLDDYFTAVGAVLNIEGGVAGDGVEVAGALVAISGGSVGEDFHALSGSTIRLSGGSVGRGFVVGDGSAAWLSGGVVSGATVHSGSTLTVAGGTTGPVQAFYEATVNVTDGTVNSVAISNASTLNVRGGVITGRIDASFGATVNVISGSVGAIAIIGFGNTVNVMGGRVGDNFSAGFNSTVNVRGGVIGEQFSVNADSTLNLSGGTVGRRFRAESSKTTIIGGEYRLNGIPYGGSSVTLGEGDVMTGTLSDGSSFLFSRQSGDVLQGVTLVDIPLPPIDATPIVLDDSLPLLRNGLRVGQTLTLKDGGVLEENFSAIGATLNIEGGGTATGLEVSESAVTLIAGAVGDEMAAFGGSTIVMSGGSIGERSGIFAGSTLELVGGTLGRSFRVGGGSTAILTGGEFDDIEVEEDGLVSISGAASGVQADVFSGGRLALSGGDLGRIGARAGSEVTIAATAFYLGDEPLDLDIGVPTPFVGRDDYLSGAYADGSPFNFLIRSESYYLGWVSPDATLTLTLLALPGDFNADGRVDAADYTVWRDRLGEAEGVLPIGSSTDGSGLVDAGDYETWRANYGAVMNAAADAPLPVPAPGGLAAAIGAVLYACGRGRRRAR